MGQLLAFIHDFTEDCFLCKLFCREGKCYCGIISPLAMAVVLAAIIVTIIVIAVKKKRRRIEDREAAERCATQTVSHEVIVKKIGEDQKPQEKSETPPVFETEPAAEPAAEVAAAEAVAVKEQGGATYGVFGIKRDKSFTARIIQSDDETKSYYGAIRNELEAFGAVPKTSWEHEVYRGGGFKLAKIKLRGKTVLLELAVPAAELDEKYKAEASSFGSVIHVNGDRKTKYAKEIIAKMMEEKGLSRQEKAPVDYVAQFAYEDTEALIARGLIKE